MFPTESLYLLMFVSGLFGGFGHCIGMCGPVVAAYSFGMGNPALPLPKKIRYSLTPHLLYNLGRITTYSLLGGVMGITGSFSAVIRPVEGFQNAAMAGIGAIMIVMGLATAGWLPLAKKLTMGKWLSDRVSMVMRYISSIPSRGAYFPMGLVNGFIPCGLLYTALMGAAGAGSGAVDPSEGFVQGMFMLLLFGLGTSPALFLLGQIASMKREWVRNNLSKGAAILLVVMGMLFVYRAVR